MKSLAGAGEIEVLLDEWGWHQRLAAEVREGLTAARKTLPSTLFYDAIGSALFERITELPEYYLTRAEEAILRAHARELVDLIRPRELLELGPGSGRKIRYLLDAGDDREPRRYVPLDVDAAGVSALARSLMEEYPGLEVHGIAGDFLQHLGRVPEARGPRLVAFFGSTIGNLHPGPRRAFLREVAALLAAGDGLLLGLDLVKPAPILELAYDDPRGVTAAFNRNILHAVNHRFDADFRAETFRHLALYNAEVDRVEMHLVPRVRQTATLRALGLSVEITPAETLWTESSYKFRRESAAAMLTEAGLALRGWYSDRRGMFALALAGTP
jgi:L-histidine N-alpha-methyltransferase